MFGLFGWFLCHWFSTRAYWKCLPAESFTAESSDFLIIGPFFCSSGKNHEVVVSRVSSTFINCSFVVICTSGFNLHSGLWPFFPFSPETLPVLWRFLIFFPPPTTLISAFWYMLQFCGCHVQYIHPSFPLPTPENTGAVMAGCDIWEDGCSNYYLASDRWWRYDRTRFHQWCNNVWKTITRA